MSSSPDIALVERLCVEFDWQSNGEITATGGLRTRLAFPRLDRDPGVYRFWIEGADAAEVYIGESGNLHRRAGTYRNPGDRYTAGWVSDWMLRRLGEGAKATMWLMVEARFSIGANEWQPNDMRRQEHRLLLENAALAAAFAEDLDEQGERVVVLNRLRDEALRQ